MFPKFYLTRAQSCLKTTTVVFVFCLGGKVLEYKNIFWLDMFKAISIVYYGNRNAEIKVMKSMCMFRAHRWVKHDT